MQALNHPASSLCCTSFNDKYIFKFGGIAENRTLSTYIEKYDIAKNIWTDIDPKIATTSVDGTNSGSN